MAKIDPTSLFTEIRGTVGGLTFSRNRAGFFVKRLTAGLPSNRPAPKQRRRAFTSASVIWNQIRNDLYEHPVYGMIPVSEWWFHFSQEPENIKTDLFGGNYTPSGYNWFQTYAMFQSLTGAAPMTLPPTDPTPNLWPNWAVCYYASTPDLKSYFNSFTTSSSQATIPWISCRIQYSQADGPLVPPYFFLDAFDYSAPITPYYLQTKLESVFGSIPANSRAYFAVRFRIPDGRISAAQTFSLTNGETYSYSAP